MPEASELLEQVHKSEHIPRVLEVGGVQRELYPEHGQHSEVVLREEGFLALDLRKEDLPCLLIVVDVVEEVQVVQLHLVVVLLRNVRGNAHSDGVFDVLGPRLGHVGEIHIGIQKAYIDHHLFFKE